MAPVGQSPHLCCVKPWSGTKLHPGSVGRHLSFLSVRSVQCTNNIAAGAWRELFPEFILLFGNNFNCCAQREQSAWLSTARHLPDNLLNVADGPLFETNNCIILPTFTSRAHLHRAVSPPLCSLCCLPSSSPLFSWTPFVHLFLSSGSHLIVHLLLSSARLLILLLLVNARSFLFSSSFWFKQHCGFFFFKSWNGGLKNIFWRVAMYFRLKFLPSAPSVQLNL